MKISITGDPELHLTLPSGLVLNPLSASMLSKYLEKYGVTITGAQARQLVKALNRYRKSYPDWVLVDVRSAQGETVRIKL